MRDVGGMELLAELVQTPGVTGREARVRARIEAYLQAHGLADEVRTDTLGSLIALRRPRPKSPPAEPPRRVLVAAHMDQPGFLVSHISLQGYLRLHPLASFDPRTLVAQRVLVCTEDGEDLPGVLMLDGRPVHTASADELRRLPELAALFVDLGLPGESVRARVRLGDMVVFAAPFRMLGPTVMGPGLDDRAGCWALIRALQGLAHHDCEIHAVWTVQEEVGSRGALPVSAGIAADIGIACDTIACCDVPGVRDDQYITRMGGGVSLQVADSSTLADMELVRHVEAIARKEGISCQRALMQGGGQDGAPIQRSRGGVRILVLGCPIRHLHSSAELAHVADLESYEALLTCLLEAF